jgi:adenylate cyclase
MTLAHPEISTPTQNETSRVKKIFRRAFSPRGIRRFQIGALIGIAVGLLITGLILVGGLRAFELSFADWFYQPRPPSGNIVLIAIDERTIDEYGWPLERITQRGFLATLSRFQPRVIVLDLVNPEQGTPAENEILADALSRSGRVVQPILGIEATRYPREPGMFPAYDSILAPAAILRTPNSTFAQVMIYPDGDGVVRRVPLAMDGAGARYPSLAVAAVALFENQKLEIEMRKDVVALGERRVPVDDQGQMLLQFVQRDALKTISYVDVMQGKADYNQLRGKIILVGPTARTVAENFPVPASVTANRASNVEVQADAIETLLSKKFLREEERAWLIASVCALAVIAGITLPRLPWLYAAVATIFYFAADLVLAYQRFDDGVIVTPLYAALALALIYALTAVYRYFSEERARAFLGRIFQGRVAANLLPRVIELYDQGALSLAGGRRIVTVMSATLRGITSLSEASAPEAVIHLLDQYTTAMIETILDSGGYVASQIGNTVIAVWNFPLAQTNHARRAVDAAFAIHAALDQLRADIQDDSAIGAAIGVATGGVVVGHLSTMQADYSIVGDVVTLSERVVALASPGQVLISSETRDEIGNDLDTRHIHSLRTRGKKEPILVWRVEAIPTVITT